MALETSLNLSEHPAHELLNLPEQHVFNDFTGFCHTVANTIDGPQIFQSLSKLVGYDVSTHRKMTKQYAEWKSVGRAELAKQKEMQKEIDQLNRKLDRTSQDLDQTHQQLVSSRDKYTGMQKELDRVKEELGSTQVQLDQRPTLSTSHEQEKVLDAQRLKLLDKLRTVNKENAILKKQLAGGMTSNVANMADPVASYPFVWLYGSHRRSCLIGQ